MVQNDISEVPEEMETGVQFSGSTPSSPLGSSYQNSKGNNVYIVSDNNSESSHSSITAAAVQDIPLETPEEKRIRMKSHRIVYFTSFIMSIGFSIVFTSVWPYLKQLDPQATKFFYGIVIAINPFGQFLMAPLLGWWGSKLGSNRLAFIISILFFVFGNIMYSLLRLVDVAYAGYTLMLSRFIIGMAAANIALCRSYVTTSTTLDERSGALGYIAAGQSLGFILGPAFQTGLAILLPESSYPPYIRGANDTLSQDMAWHRPLWDLYTAPGWIAAAIGVFNLLLFLPCSYNEVNISVREARAMRNASKAKSLKYPNPDYFALVVLLVNFFFIMFVYILLETIIVPLVTDLYAWSSEFAIKTVGICMSIIGVQAFVMFFLTGLLVKHFDERKLYLFLGILPLCFAMLLHFPVGNTYPLMQDCTSPNISDSSIANSTLIRTKRALLLDSEGDCDAVGCPQSQEWCNYTPVIALPQLIVANLVGVIGYPVAFALSSAIFSKMIGPTNQGAWMGILTSTGSLSRMFGPIFVTVSYSQLGTRWTFGMLTVIMIVIFFFGCLIFKRLVPLDITKDRNSVEMITVVSDATE